MPSTEPKVVLPARVPRATRTALERLARSHGCTLSAEIRRALAAHVDAATREPEEFTT